MQWFCIQAYRFFSRRKRRCFGCKDNSSRLFLQLFTQLNLLITAKFLARGGGKDTFSVVFFVPVLRLSAQVSLWERRANAALRAFTAGVGAVLLLCHNCVVVMPERCSCRLFTVVVRSDTDRYPSCPRPLSGRPTVVVRSPNACSGMQSGRCIDTATPAAQVGLSQIGRRKDASDTV